MARKEVEEDAPDTGGWINTFADLMNLLLCFFVLLFSMSSVDADQYEAVVSSMTNSIDIYDGGSPSMGEGAFVSSGTDQLVSISEFFNTYDAANEEQEESKTKEEDKKNNQSSQTKKQTQASDEQKEQEIKDKLMQEEQQQKKDNATKLYSEISDRATDKKIVDIVNVNMDAQYQYVQISLKGAILFDSGKADIKKSAIPVLSKVGDILRNYSNNTVKIEGHSDNVPISGGIYRNNMELSTARANSVFSYFVDKKGLNPKKIETAGRGEYTPRASNSTAKGRTKNRRIEIKIYTTE